MKAAKIGSRLGLAYHTQPIIHSKEALPGGGRGGSPIARLNFKKSYVGVYKCFMSVSEIEQKFFVLVGILEKGDSDVL